MGDRRTPEGLALIEELLNTLDVEIGEDALTGDDGLAAVSARHGVRLTAADLPGVVRLREALRDACVAHTGAALPPDRAAALTGLLAAAPLTLRVDASGRTRLVPAPGLSGLAAFTAGIAAAIAAAEADGTWQRLKACEAESCRWAYYDHSPAGRRRWCSMQVCGSRAKMRAYRAKQRGD